MRQCLRAITREIISLFGLAIERLLGISIARLLLQPGTLIEA